MGLGLLLIFLGLYLALGQESYRAWARIKIDLPSADYTLVANNRITLGSYDPNLLQSELEVAQSELILRTVIQALNLNEEWGKRSPGGAPLPTPKTVTML